MTTFDYQLLMQRVRRCCRNGHLSEVTRWVHQENPRCNWSGSLGRCKEQAAVLAGELEAAYRIGGVEAVVEMLRRV